MSSLVSCVFFFFKQKTAYEMRISDWSSDVCSSDLLGLILVKPQQILDQLRRTRRFRHARLPREMKGAQHDARRIRRQLLAKDAKWRLVGSAIEHGRMRNPVLAPRPRMFCREPISKPKPNRRSGNRKDKGWFRD